MVKIFISRYFWEIQRRKRPFYAVSRNGAFQKRVNFFFGKKVLYFRTKSTNLFFEVKVLES